MLARELLESASAALGDRDAHDAVVVGVLMATHQAGGFGSVDELHDAVVSQEQVGREVADVRITGLHTASYGKEELVLRGRDPGVGGALLGPVQIPAEAGAKGEEALVVLVRKCCGGHE